MKVLHIINSYSRSGAELLAAQLLAAMPKEWERHVCAIGLSLDEKDAEVICFLESEGVIVHQLGKKVRSGRISAVLKMRHIIKGLKPDILHTHCESPDLFGRLASIGLSLHRFRTIHNHEPWSYAPVIGYLLEKALSPFSLTTIACSPGMGKAFDRCATPKRHRVTIANGIKMFPVLDAASEKQEWLRCLDLPAETILVGSVGRVTRQKGHDLLISALPALLRRYPNLIVVLAGAVGTEPEYYARVEAALQETKLGSAVRFVGTVTQIPSFMAACDVLVFPSRWEGLSLAILEALSSGTPTLVSSCHPHPFLLTGPYKQLLFETENVGDLERGLCWALGAKASEIPNARTLVENEYSFERMLQGYVDCYERCMDA